MISRPCHLTHCPQSSFSRSNHPDLSAAPHFSSDRHKGGLHRVTGVVDPGPIEPSPGVVSGENAIADRRGTVGLSPTKQPPLIHYLQPTNTNNKTTNAYHNLHLGVISKLCLILSYVIVIVVTSSKLSPTSRRLNEIITLFSPSLIPHGA